MYTLWLLILYYKGSLWMYIHKHNFEFKICMEISIYYQTMNSGSLRKNKIQANLKPKQTNQNFVSWLQNWLKIICTWGFRGQLVYLNTKIYIYPQLDFSKCWVSGKRFSCYYTRYLASSTFCGRFCFVIGDAVFSKCGCWQCVQKISTVAFSSRCLWHEGCSPPGHSYWDEDISSPASCL